MNRLENKVLPPAEKWAVLVIMLLFTAIFCSISLVNHYNFRTSALDLSYYSQALYDYSQFRYNYHTLSYTPFVSTLGDHWEPILFILAPLRYIFGNITPLVIQIIAIVLGGLGIFRFFHLKSSQRWLPHLAMLHFYSIWGVYAALAFDFHASVLGAVLLPWIFYGFAKSDLRLIIGFWILFLMCAEKMAIWGVFISAALAILHRKDRKLLYTSLGLAGFSMLYFVLAVKFFMPPHLKPKAEYRHFNYSHLGENYGEVLQTMIKRPGYAISLLWENPIADNPRHDFAKPQTLRMLLYAGGFVIFIRPVYALMLLPIVGMNLLSDKLGAWGITRHYSMEYVPVLCLGLFSFISEFQRPRTAQILGGIAVVVTLSSSMIALSTRPPVFHCKECTLPFLGDHWTRPEFEVGKVYELLELIPPKVNVAASSTIAPHLSMRDSLYMFPRTQHVEYAITMKQHHTYPLTPAKMEAHIQKMVDSGNWEILGDNEVAVALRRR